MGKITKDAYANVAFGTCTQSAINTLTFAQIQFGVGLFEGRALIIHRIEWNPTFANLREIVAATDSLTMALTTSNRMTGISDLSDPAIVSQNAIIGIGVAVEPTRLPILADYSSLPGGGKLLPANPLFVAVNSGGFAAVCTIRCRLDFSFVELSPQDYLEVIQSMFPANIA